MKKAMTEFRVGLFVAAGLVLAMMIIFMIGSQHRLFERQYTLYTSFENISGLRIGAPVQLAGLKVGYVDEIRFPTDIKTQEIGVEMKVQKKYQNRVRKDSVATIETQGLLGDKFIYLSVGSESEPVVEDEGVIVSKTTTSIFSLADKAGKIMDDIGEGAKALTDMLSSVKGKKGDGDLKASIASIRKTIEQIEKGKGFLHALIYDPRGEQAVEDLAATLKSAKDIASEADKESIIANLRKASTDLKNVMDSIKRGDGTIGKLINDPALYDDLRALLGRANKNNLLKAVIRSTISENDKQVLK